MIENVQKINEILAIEQGDIVDVVEKYGVDSIVNVAHPTLRRGTGDGICYIKFYCKGI